MFEKSLVDMVKGIRSAGPVKEGVFISKCVAEIAAELKGSDASVKAQAVLKAVYLHMLGFEMADAPFHVVEVMSQPLYGQKRVGYLAAANMFHPGTDVILLTTHLFRKSFTQGAGVISSGAEGLQYEIGSAINCLANIVTQDLAMDLLSDVYGMMNSSRPYVRRKAVLMLLRVFHVWPKALRLSFDRLKEKLLDEEPAVVAAAVYVLCELAAANPKNYLALAPLFFKILTTSTNNWVLIKIVKLLGFLVPLEPRLAKKLANPLSEIVETTPAKSLQYECINTLLAGEITSKSVIRLCLSNLRGFIEHPDQNLKYLGLLGLHRLMRQHPRAVEDHKDLVLACLGDEDATIRLRALDIITAMASKRTLRAIVRKLVEHLEVSDGQYRDTVLRRIVEICSQDSYEFITDFEWYISTLVDLTHLGGVSRENADLITSQLIDVTVRVEEVQPFAVGVMERVLHDRRLYSSHNAMSRVLYAAGWVVGEFAEHVHLHAGVVEAMLGPDVAGLAPEVQTVFVQALLKVYASALRLGLAVGAGGPEALAGAAPPASGGDGHPPTPQAWRDYMARLSAVLAERLPVFCRSNDVEVQERAVSSQHTLAWVAEQIAGAELPSADLAVLIRAFAALFDDKLNPVAPKAQKRVPVPKGLDLDKWINEPPSDSDSEGEDGGGDDDDFYGDGGSAAAAGGGRRQLTEEEEEEAARQRARERERRANDPYYIKDSSRRTESVDVDSIPVRPVEFDLPAVKVEKEDRKGRRKGRRKKGFFGDDEVDDEGAAGGRSYTVKKVSDEPRARKSKGGQKKKKRRGSGDSSASDSSDNELGKVDLSRPLDASETISKPQTYAERQRERKEAEAAAAEAKKGKKDQKKAKKDKKKAKKDKKKKKKKGGDGDNDKAAAPEADLLGIFDPLAGDAAAAAPAAEEGPAKAKKSKKDKKKDKKKRRGSAAGAAAAVAAGGSVLDAVPEARVRCPLKNGDLALRWAVTTSPRHPKEATVLLSVTAAGRALSGVTVSVGDSNFSRVRGSREVSAGAVAARAEAGGAVRLQIVKATELYQTELAVTYTPEGGSETTERRQVPLPASSLVHPERIEMPELRELLMRQDDGAGSCRKLASRGGLVLHRYSVSEALKAIPKLLCVRLVEAVSFTATYYGRTVHGAHVAVLVKANKADVGAARPMISVDIKTSHQYLSDALLEEISVLAAE